MTMIEPINEQQQHLVVTAAEDCLRKARDLFSTSFDPITIEFDLSGRAAGMYCRRGKQRWIRFNPYIFAKYFEDNLVNTVVHEIAHYIADVLYGANKIRPHGQEWKSLMQALGATPKRTCSYDLEGIPRRHFKQFSYACDCSSHQLGSRRHNKISQGKARYYCRKCRQTLSFSANPALTSSK